MVRAECVALNAVRLGCCGKVRLLACANAGLWIFAADALALPLGEAQAIAVFACLP